MLVLKPFVLGSPSALLWLYLALVAALTLPHVVLVLWMDRVQQLLAGPEPAVQARLRAC